MKSALAVLALLVVLGLVLSFLVFPPAPRNVAMLLVNGRIYTLDERHPLADAIAIDGDKIAGVGSETSLRSRFYADHVINLGGKAVYPGFIDAHAHLEALGIALRTVDLVGTKSPEEIAALVGRAVRDSSAGGWIRGRGWDQNRWRGEAFPTHELLDRVAPHTPVVLIRIDGHAAWLNREAMMRAGITAKTTDPPGGRILRDRHGEPTGVLIDLAVPIALAAMPPSSLAERRNSVRKAVSTCLAFGLTEVHDMGVDAEGIDLYRSMIQDGEFPFRVYVAVEGSSRESWERWRTRGPEIGTGGGKLTVRALKMYADGALGSRGAALIEPYADDPGNRGLTLTSKGDLLAAARDAIDHGFQLCTHAIGDRANAIVLDVYTLALHGRKGAYDDRFRIEHAQVLAPTDIPRFAALGVLPVMQATHCTSDMPWAEERLGADRSRGAYAWRSLLATGTIIPGGSDFPVESPDPLLGFYASITRQDAQGNPPGGWFPEQTMTREEALRSITLWGAYAAFQENEKGSLEAGKWADLTVLSKDIMKIPPKEILSTRVAMTMVAGSIVYQAPGESLRLP